MNYLTGLAAQHPKILLIIFIIALALIFFIFVLPFIFKLIGIRKNNKETAALKKDLMIWRRISGLAKGGNEAEKSKRLIAKGQIEILRDSFRNGISMIRSGGRGLYDTPWYLCIGEPSSGKSVLMNDSELDMIVSENESTEPDGTTKHIPLRFWMGSQAVVLEMGGKSFFDRWFGGGSAEFGELIKLLRSHHRKKPLSGIILTIPADALIADDPELCKKKASLIAAEFHKLVYKFSMRLPCYVVITKLDVVTGFRDYFSDLDDNMREKIFGWDSPLRGSGYDKSVFEDFWKETIDTLRKGRNTLLLPKSPDKENRAEEAANIFMFPEAFAALYPNLEIYLKTIFGMRKVLGLDNLKLEGVYFTSGKDEGIALDPAFARLKKSSIDDAPMYYGPKNLKSFFTADLLIGRIFPENPYADYTDTAKAKQYIPYYISASLFMALGLMWGASALFSYDKVAKTINAESAYYKRLELLLTNKVLDMSPLISVGKDGRGILLFNEPLAYNPGIKRIDFFSKTYNQTLTPWRAPYGFKTSSFIKYGHTDMAYDERRFVFDKIQTRMAFIPVLKAIENNFQETVSKPVTKPKREAIEELLKIAAIQERKDDLLKNAALYRQNAMNTFLAYLFPDISPEIRKVLGTYYPLYDKNILTANLEILFSPGYARGYEAGVKSLINGWKSLVNYPESAYSLHKNLIRYGAEMENLFIKYKAFSPLPLDPYNIEPLENNVKEWFSLYEKQKDTTKKITDAMKRLWDYYKDTAGEIAGEKINISMVLPAAYLSYSGQLAEDFDMLDAYGRVNIKRNDGYNDYHTLIETAYLKNIQDEVRQNLKDDYDILKTQVVSIESNPFFKDALNSEDNKTENGDPNYMVMANILDLATVKEYKFQDNGTAGFERAWRNNEKLTVSRKQALNDYIKKYEGNFFTEALTPISRQMLDMQISYGRIALADSAFDFYPSSSAELVSKIYRLGQSPDMGDIFVKDSNKEVRGKIAFQGEFDPQAADLYIKPFGILRNFLTEKDKNGEQNYETEYFAYNKRYLAISRMMDDYTENFIKYWSRMGDMLAPKFASYANFHSFVSSVKAYGINSMLYSVYDRSFKILSDMSDSLLTPASAAEKANALTLLTGRRNTLNVNYSEYCTKLLDSWASLPSSATDSNKMVMSITDRRLKTEFLPLQEAYSTVGDIPWWRHLFDRGTKLLKTEAAEEASRKVKSYRSYFTKFPLLAEGNIYDAVSPEEMKNIAAAFREFGWFNEKEEAQESELALKAPISLSSIVKNENDAKDWGNKTLRILNAMAFAEPLEWTLVIPDPATQAKLVAESGYERSAMARFRYADVSYSFIKSTRRFPTNAAQNKEIDAVTDNAAVSDIIFNFYIHSDSKLPETNVRIPGSWAPIRLYLKEGGIKDPEKGVHYIPLTMRDAMELEYIFYIGIKFNRPLPEPEEWPSSKNIPEFIY